MRWVLQLGTIRIRAGGGDLGGDGGLGGDGRFTSMQGLQVGSV